VQEIINRQSKEEPSIDDKEDKKDRDKEGSAQDGYFAVEGVTEEVKDDKERRRNVTKKKKRVENTKEKTHDVLLRLILSIVSSVPTPYNNLS
jgi:hypothetical protein